MQSSRVLLQQRQPMIRFLGKRHAPSKLAAAEQPQPHPAAPSSSLPESFASYRQKAIQHGPLKTQPQPQQRPSDTTISYGASGHSLGSVQPGKGEYFDRSELPSRFRRVTWTLEEMEAIDSGGASMWQ